jgi:hypothetical protein
VRTDRGDTFANSAPGPSAIVGCVRIASRSTGYGRRASIAVCTAAMTSPASAPIIVKPRMRSSLSPTRTYNTHYWQVYFDTSRTIRETFGEAAYPVPDQHYSIRTLAS